MKFFFVDNKHFSFFIRLVVLSSSSSSSSELRETSRVGVDYTDFVENYTDLKI
jgi:hypothetical protein